MNENELENCEVRAEMSEQDQARLQVVPSFESFSTTPIA